MYLPEKPVLLKNRKIQKWQKYAITNIQNLCIHCRTDITVYNHSLDVIKELERKGEVFVIQPDKKLDISRMENNLEVIQQVYDMGEKDAHIRMKALKDWMNLPEV